MKNIIVHPSFTPTNAPSNETYEYGKKLLAADLRYGTHVDSLCEAITLEAGVQWHEAYDAVTAANRVLVGGASVGGSVGAAGGWLLGGGHSALTPTYGLGTQLLFFLNSISFCVPCRSRQRPRDHRGPRIRRACNDVRVLSLRPFLGPSWRRRRNLRRRHFPHVPNTPRCPAHRRILHRFPKQYLCQHRYAQRVH